MKEQFLQVKEVVANSLSILPNPTDAERAIFRQWVYIAQRDLGFPSLDVREADIVPHDLAVQKPDDFSSAIDVALFLADGVEVTSSYKGGGKKIHDEFRRGASTVQISETPNFFHMESTGADVTCFTLKYYGLPIDDDGNPKIPERCNFAIMMFIKWMWSVRNSESIGIREQNRRDWMMEARKQRAKNKMPSMLEGKQIVKSWMSMIDKAIRLSKQF